jgi:hypothetical protein
LAKVAVVLEIQGIKFDGPANMRNCFRGTPTPREKESIPVMSIAEIGIQLEGTLELTLCRSILERASVRTR